MSAPIVNWPTASGQRLSFQLDPIGASYLQRPGVYIFTRQAANGNWDALYVGETDDFNRRLTRELVFHHRWPCIQKAGATHICTLHVPGKDVTAREAVETDIRQATNPQCNRQ